MRTTPRPATIPAWFWLGISPKRQAWLAQHEARKAGLSDPQGELFDNKEIKALFEVQSMNRWHVRVDGIPFCKNPVTIGPDKWEAARVLKVQCCCQH